MYIVGLSIFLHFIIEYVHDKLYIWPNIMAVTQEIETKAFRVEQWSLNIWNMYSKPLSCLYLPRQEVLSKNRFVTFC